VKRRSDAALTEARKTRGRMRAEGYTAQAIAAIWAVPPHTVSRWDSQAQAGGDRPSRDNDAGAVRVSRGAGALGRTSPSGRRCAAQHRRRWACRLPCGPGERSRC